MEEKCKHLRNEIQDLAIEVRKLMEHGYFVPGRERFSGQRSEMKVQIRLAYRHLEDARMRLLWVQQIQGGTSIFDEPAKEGSRTDG